MLEDAFLRDIVSNPDDEAVRLIYADWLEEQGNPRGEFIRIQCQLARWAGDSTDWRDWAMIARNLTHLRKREKELLKEHGDTWKAALGVTQLNPEFRRGFVEKLQLPTKAFVERGEEYFRLMPLQEVVFFPRDLSMAQLADCPLLGRLRSVAFLQPLSLRDMGLFASSSHLQRLTRLTLSTTLLGDISVRALAGSPLLSQLTALDLRRSGITMESLRALLRSPVWEHLHHIDIRGNPGIGARQLNQLIEELIPTGQAWRLQSLLREGASRELTPSDRFAQQLAEEAGANEVNQAAILGEALSSSHRKRRAAAATMIGRLGEKAFPHLSALVRRLNEGRGASHDTLAISDRAAASLARLALLLPEELQSWLGIVANPLRSAVVNIHSATTERPLPQEVADAFAGLCQRRATWWRQVIGEEAAPTALPIHTTWQELQQLVDHVLSLAASRKSNVDQSDAALRSPADAASEKEAGWLLARLWELLQRHYLKP
jgi:uncharacterized protein (TIGR02996 family)